MTENQGNNNPAATDPAGAAPPPPPPPPPAGYEAPPASGYQAPPAPPPMSAYARELQNFDPKSVNRLDWGIIACGLVALIFSFFSYYTVSVSLGSGFGSVSAHESAWHGFFGWFGALLAFVAAALLAANLIAKITFSFPVRTAVLGGFAIALLCAILALFLVPVDTGGFDGIDKGHGFGYWISSLAILVGAVLAFLRFTATGGRLPTKR